jgi:hypothetical protein
VDKSDANHKSNAKHQTAQDTNSYPTVMSYSVETVFPAINLPRSNDLHIKREFYDEMRATKVTSQTSPKIQTAILL